MIFLKDQNLIEYIFFYFYFFPFVLTKNNDFFVLGKKFLQKKNYKKYCISNYVFCKKKVILIKEIKNKYKPAYMLNNNNVKKKYSGIVCLITCIFYCFVFYQ